MAKKMALTLSEKKAITTARATASATAKIKPMRM